MHKIGRLGAYMLLASAMLLHLTVLNRVKVFGAEPDLVLILVIFFALFGGARMGLEMGSVAGMLKDLFSCDTFGMNLIALGFTGFAIGILNAKFFKESKRTQAIIIFSSTIFALVIHYVLLTTLSDYSHLGLLDYIMSSIAPVSIYTVLAAMPIFSRLINLYHLNEPEDLL